jgi:hypothetical protein
LEAAKEGEKDIDAEDPSNGPLVIFFQLMGAEVTLEDSDYD